MQEQREFDAHFFRQPGHLINRVARLFARVGESRLREVGLSVAQLPVLVLLKDGQAFSQKELVEKVQIEQPTMAQLLTRMERDGLIQRLPNPQDGRSSLFRLTQVAIDRLPDGRQVLYEGNREALKGFSDDEIEMFTQFLQRVIQNVEALAVPIALKDEVRE